MDAINRHFEEILRKPNGDVLKFRKMVYHLRGILGASISLKNPWEAEKLGSEKEPKGRT
jgi:hypothetical protein